MPVPTAKLPAPGNPISFSQLNTEFRGSANSNSQLSMSQLGYGGNILRANNCTAQIRGNPNSPYYANIGQLKEYSGNGSDLNIGNFRSKWIYSAPPISESVLTGDNDQYNFNAYYSGGRNYNPNQDKKNTNPLFIDIRNSGTCYSSSKNNASSYSANIPDEPSKGGTIVYFDNDGNIYGSGGNGGNGGDGSSDEAGGNGGPGGNGLRSTCERLYLNNDGVIYGGGGGGGGGGSTHVRYREGPFATSDTNCGNGGGGGGGGRGYVGGDGGEGGNDGPNFGCDGNDGKDGSLDGYGDGGSGQNCGCSFGYNAGESGDGGNGGGWGSAGSDGGTGDGGKGSGGPAGNSIVADVITYVKVGTTAGSISSSTPF